MPKYSFIVPVYGCEKYLEACVQSILAQQGDHDFEVILVDDGSRDRSGQIADDLARRDPRIRTFHKENGGAASARNYGLRQAKGEYILFVDGDDTVEDQLLEAVDAALETNPGALIIFGMAFDYYRDSMLVRAQQLSCCHEGCYAVKQLLEDYKSFFYDNALSSACNKVFSAEVIRNRSLQMTESMALYEDYEFVLRYLSCVDTVSCIAKPFYHYRNDLDKNHLDRRVEDLGKMQDDLGKLLQTVRTLSTNSVQLREATANLYLLLMWKHLKVSRYTTAELTVRVTQYCAQPDFRAMLTPETELGNFEGKLFQQIENGAFQALNREIKRKKRIARLKHGIKNILKAAGLKRF